VSVLRRMRRIADEHSGSFTSGGMRRLLSMLSKELTEDYLHRVEQHLKGLEFRSGLRMSAKLGEGNKGSGYILLKFDPPRLRWYERIKQWLTGVDPHRPEGLTYHVHERDEAGLTMLGQIKNYGIGNVASAVSQSTDHILNFFQMLRLELAFYIGCLNLHEELHKVAAPICFPEPKATKKTALTSHGLYDVSQQLRSQSLLIRNDLAAGDKSLVMITGANRGGKSTFLRAIGLAQLMMQCGMFVAAESFRSNPCRALFTHFKRREDAQMKSGKLDEELKRMSDIVDQLQSGDMVLFNESFSSTNEREGSQIAREIVTALLEVGIKVIYVTHMYELAEGLYRSQRGTTLFLRAERLDNGDRTFRLIQGEPLPTSYGADLYQRIFSSTNEREVA
jgi:DNA mismatch repair ATPase MutS